MIMDAKDFLHIKVTNEKCNGGYEDLKHYLDCRHEEEMEKEIPIWMEQYAEMRIKTLEYIKKFNDKC